MKKLLWVLLMAPFLAQAQEGKGVRFEDSLSWTAIQAKARAENKYIFMDCFTTWCGPCKYMATQLFPQKEAGDYFNDKFISVSVQLDTSKADNYTIKAWYADAHAIMEKYDIKAYPTFLVFTPDGRAIHRMVGSSPTAADFKKRVAEAFDPGKQYYTLMDQYNQGKRDSASLRKMTLAAMNVYEKTRVNVLLKSYLATQPDVYSKGSLELIYQTLQEPGDIGFDMFVSYPEKVDAVLGEGVAEGKVLVLVARAEIYPVILKGNVPSPDWDALKNHVVAKYPKLADELIAQGKAVYYQQKDDWADFQPAIIAYMQKYGTRVGPEELNTFAWDVFQHCPDMTCVSDALEWSKRSFKDHPNPLYIDTYANILYKIGKKDDAIAWEEKAINMLSATDPDRQDLKKNLDKMQKGEKTWD